MNEKLKYHILATAASIAMLSGAALTWQTGRFLGVAAGRLTRKSRDLAELRAMEKRLSRYAAAVRELERLDAGRTVPLRTLLDESFPGRKADDTTESLHESISGWTLRRQDIALSEADLKGVAAFVAAAEARDPPWRLVKCEIRSSENAAGRGQVGLVMEALERSRP